MVFVTAFSLFTLLWQSAEQSGGTPRTSSVEGEASLRQKGRRETKKLYIWVDDFGSRFKNSLN